MTPASEPDPAGPVTGDRRSRVAADRLAAVVETTAVAIVSVDRDGRIAGWNRGAADTFGHRAPELLGRPAVELAPPAEQETFAELLRLAAGGETVIERHTSFLTRGGAEVEVAVTLAPIAPDGSVGIMARDVTEQRWLAATLDQSLDSLRRALDDAREAEAATRRFLADVAHQLRTPVAGIQASAEVLMGADLPPETAARLLSNIVTEAGRAGRLMASLLRMARLEQGEALVPRPTDVAIECEAAVETVRVLAPGLHISVDAAAMEGLRPRVDPHALGEILTNLLDNARRYARTRVDVTVRPLVDAAAADAVEIRVSDDGPGLPEGRENEAFDRFVRLDDAGGSGLGLAIARSLARAHGGDLTWSGSAFIVRLGA